MVLPSLNLKALFDAFAQDLQWSWQSRPPTSDKSVIQGQNLPWMHPFHPDHPAIIQIVSPGERSTFKAFCQNPSHTHEGVFILTEAQKKPVIYPNPALEDNAAFLQTPQSAQTVYTLLMPYLARELSPRLTLHGTFIEVMGKGILLRGESGSGKSLSALFCVQNQHRLIADDVPAFYRQGIEIYGECHPALKHQLEIRHFGIVDIKKGYGPLSVRDSHKLDLIIDLTSLPPLSEHRCPELNVLNETLLGINIPKIHLAFTEHIARLIENSLKYVFDC